MTLTRRDCDDLAKAISKHNNSNPFNTSQFTYDQLCALAAFCFGDEAIEAKHEWMQCIDVASAGHSYDDSDRIGECSARVPLPR